MYNSLKQNSENRGFTLLEVLYAISLLVGILAVIFVLSFDLIDFTNFFDQNLSRQEELQATLKVMRNELRALNSSAVGSYAIEAADATTLIFFSDRDGDGLTERLRYFLEGDIFKKGVIKPMGNPPSYPLGNEQLSEAVHFVVNGSQPIFTFYAAGSTKESLPLAEPIDIAQIRLIKAYLLADQNPLALPGPTSLEIWAVPRNLRY